MAKRSPKSPGKRSIMQEMHETLPVLLYCYSGVYKGCLIFAAGFSTGGVDLVWTALPHWSPVLCWTGNHHCTLWRGLRLHTGVLWSPACLPAAMGTCLRHLILIPFHSKMGAVCFACDIDCNTTRHLSPQWHAVRSLNNLVSMVEVGSEDKP